MGSGWERFVHYAFPQLLHHRVESEEHQLLVPPHERMLAELEAALAERRQLEVKARSAIARTEELLATSQQKPEASGSGPDEERRARVADIGAQLAAARANYAVLEEMVRASDDQHAALRRRVDELEAQRARLVLSGKRLDTLAIAATAGAIVTPLVIWGCFDAFPIYFAGAGDLGPFLAMVGVLIIGGIAFQLRLLFRRVYGLAELGVAAVAAFFAGKALLAGVAKDVAMLQGAGAVYLTVRAVDNIWNGHRAAVKLRDDALKRAKDAGLLVSGLTVRTPPEPAPSPLPSPLPPPPFAEPTR